MAKYTFVVLSNSTTPAEEAEYNEWYNKIHIPDVLNVPGFVAAQRFKLAETQFADGKPETVVRSCEASLQRLQMDHIDLYQIHGNDAVTPVEETLRALDTLVQQGKVRYIGCSNWQAWKIAKALGISEFKNLARFDTLQAYYSIAGRDLERDIVPLLEAAKTGLLVWSPLAGGLLSGKFSRENQKPEGTRRSEFDFPIVDKERTWKILDVIGPIAKAHGCSPARVSLAWLLAKPVVSSVIIGAKRLDQLQDNIAAVDLKLTDEELKRLDEASVLPPEYPGWMLPFQGANRLSPVPRPIPATRKKD